MRSKHSPIITGKPLLLRKNSQRVTTGVKTNEKNINTRYGRTFTVLGIRNEGNVQTRVGQSIPRQPGINGAPLSLTARMAEVGGAG